MWRGVFYALLAAVGIAAAATPYVASVSFPAVVGYTLLPLAFYLITFLVWLAKLWPESPVPVLRDKSREAALTAIDRTGLFVGSGLFFTWLPPIKATFPAAHGFWADARLASVDRALLGQDAWKISHSLFGALTREIDYFYNLWVVIIVVISLCVALFASERRMAAYFLGIALSWTVLGTGLASSLASAGPIFGPDLGYGFSDLRAQLGDARLTMLAHDILWNTYQSGLLRIGGGISAAPSIHCALTFVFCLSAYKTRWFVPAVAYSVFIWVGSVHLGWHYFIDGLLSLLGVLAMWPLVLWMREPTWPRRRRLAAA